MLGSCLTLAVTDIYTFRSFGRRDLPAGWSHGVRGEQIRLAFARRGVLKTARKRNDVREKMHAAGFSPSVA